MTRVEYIEVTDVDGVKQTIFTAHIQRLKTVEVPGETQTSIILGKENGVRVKLSQAQIIELIYPKKPMYLQRTVRSPGVSI